MKKVIADVVNFPNDCETVRFTACFVSMLMRAEGMTDPDCAFFCDKQGGDCIRCGGCKDLIPLQKLHSQLYNLYTAVTGYGFLQIDLSDDTHMDGGWELTCQKLLREFDYYVGFTMDFAGYEFEEVQAPESEASILSKIKGSIDRDVPVLMQLAKQYQWILITGYDDDGVLYGFDGSQGYWGKSTAGPAGYEDGLFVLPDWYEKLAHAFILGEKKEPSVTLQDVFRRGIKIMESMQAKGYYRNSVAYMRNDGNFDGLNDAELLSMRDRISGWIGQPIDQRAMLGYSMNPLRVGKEPSREIVAYNVVHGLCWTMHDVLWIAWNMLGEYKDGERIYWAKGLQNKTVRGAVADCIDFVHRHDEYMLDRLKEAF